MNVDQAHRLLLDYQRVSRIHRVAGNERKAQVADRRAAECQAVLQIARMVKGTK